LFNFRFHICLGRERFVNLGQITLKVYKIELDDFNELSLVLVGELLFTLGLVEFRHLCVSHSLVLLLFFIVDGHLLTLHLLLLDNEALLSFTIHLENQLSVIQDIALGSLLNEFIHG
jgi:hypothetical protein